MARERDRTDVRVHHPEPGEDVRHLVVDEAHVEDGVVRDEDGGACEVEPARGDLVEGRSSGDHLVAVVELPGMRKEDIDISLHDGTLTISGERKRENRGGEKAERTERYFGAFRRSIALPTRVDASKVSATYKDGILKVTLPKAEEARPKQIQVS